MNCTTDETFQQTLFLGCSVESYSASLGWGEQPSEVTVTLIRDTCSGSKIYYDLTASPVEQTYVGADPGFNIYGDSSNEPPRLGSPVYFRVGDFEYCGILQNWQRIDPASNVERYQVKLTGPTEVLEGVQVIIGDYVGDVVGFNIINAYGFQEFLNGTSCTTYSQTGDGPIFGSIAGGFAGAGVNAGGMPFEKIRFAVNVLTSQIPSADTTSLSDYSAYGRVVYHGANANAAYGLIPHDDEDATIETIWGLESNIAYYLVDLSDIPITASDYRIAGTSVSLLNLISQVCTDYGHDFYLELMPILIGGSVYKFIKVRTVSRLVQPSLGVIEQFITDIQNSGGVVSSQYGRELRNESASNFLIGGNKKSMYEVYNGSPASDPDDAYFTANYGSNLYVRDRIVPYFGSNISGDINVLYDDGNGNGLNSYYVNVDFSPIKDQLNNLGPLISNHNIYLGEMSAASEGFDSWISCIHNLQSPIAQILKAGGVNVPTTWNTLGRLAANKLPGLLERDLINTVGDLNTATALVYNDLKVIQEYIANIYDNSRRQMLVRLPYTCLSYANGYRETTDIPTNGGWTEKSSIIGLANPGAVIDYFKNPDGTIAPVAVFAGSGMNFEALPSSKYFYAGTGYLYVQCNVGNEILFLNNFSGRSPRVVVDIPGIDEIDNTFNFNRGFTTNKFAGAANAAVLTAANTGFLTSGLNPELLNFASDSAHIEPYGMMIPMESTVHTYGPWRPSNAIEAGPPGRINIEKDDTLVPWSYDGLTALDTVAQAKSNASVTATIYGENGSLVVDGYPDTPLGSELASLRGVGSSFYSSNQHLFENRTVASASAYLTNQYYYLEYGAWSGDYGPTATSISVDFPNGGPITTAYTFRTFSPQFGTLTKLNAERLAARARDFAQVRKNFRLQSFINQLQNQNLRAVNKLTKKINKAVNAAERRSNNRSIGALTGRAKTFVVGGKSSTRHDVMAKPLDTLQDINDSVERFDNTAIMSWDGLIRPVSLGGDGNLPRLITPGNTSITGDDSSLNINTYTLSFLTNPTGSFSHLSDFGASGHDIDMLARGSHSGYSMTGAGSTSLSMYASLTGNINDYYNDYRFMAMRGPLMLHSWGYDTNGYPVPNRADTESAAASGIFASGNLQYSFLSGFDRKSHTWPVAPVDLRLDRQRGVWVGGAFGGSGGGSTLRRARVYDDISKYDFSLTPSATVSTVRCLPFSRSGSTISISPSASVINAEPAFSTTVPMDNTDGDCCCGSSSSNSVGPTISYPLSTDARIDGTNGPDGNESSLLVAGSNAQPSSTLTIYILIKYFLQDGTPNGITNLQEDATINADGTWTATFDLSTGDSSKIGVVIVRAVETLIGTPEESLPSVYAMLTWAKGFGASPMAVVDDTPTQAPILNSESNTGDPNDLITSDQFPKFTIASTRVSTASGPGYRLYANGIMVAEEIPTDSVFVAQRATAQVVSALPEGRHRITYTLLTDEGGVYVESGHSPPLDITIDLDVANTDDQIWATRYASGPFGTGDVTIGLNGVFTLVNNSNLTDPPAPSFVNQPDTRLIGNSGDLIQLQKQTIGWKVVSRDLGAQRYSRECVLCDMDSINTIVYVSPCAFEITPQEAIILDRPEDE